jgi:hypothetical protein
LQLAERDDETLERSRKVLALHDRVLELLVEVVERGGGACELHFQMGKLDVGVRELDVPTWELDVDISERWAAVLEVHDRVPELLSDVVEREVEARELHLRTGGGAFRARELDLEAHE